MTDSVTLTPTIINEPGAVSDAAFGINDGGTIVCSSLLVGESSYLEDNGTYHALTDQAAPLTAFLAYGINDDGVVVGELESSSSDVGAFDTNGMFTTVSAFGDPTVLCAINDSGEAIGTYESNENTWSGFIDQGGKITNLSYSLGYNTTDPLGINNLGEIVGAYGPDGAYHGFTYLDGKFTTVDFPGASSTVLQGINDEGVIVGQYTDGNGTSLHGFIDINGKFTSVDFAGNAGYGESVNGINNAGQIVGFETGTNGFFEAVTAEVACFRSGTRILTDHGNLPVETLRIGDRVVTVHAGLQPIKWIGTRTYTAPFCNHDKILPIRIAANAIAENIPSRDLAVSPGHAIHLDGVLIHAVQLLNGVTITQLPSLPEITYFHIELENHEIILADNCPSETYRGECFRRQFQNAENFSALYPGSQAPENFSAPLVTHGFHLAAILRRLRARAGIPPKTPGKLRGYIDQHTDGRISGWARDLAAPDEPVILDILAGGKRLGRTIANIPRPDVAAAGYGSGNHGFEFLLPPRATGAITVRRAGDATPLPSATIARAA